MALALPLLIGSGPVALGSNIYSPGSVGLALDLVFGSAGLPLAL